jgi:hypothetical protein
MGWITRCSNIGRENGYFSSLKVQSGSGPYTVFFYSLDTGAEVTSELSPPSSADVKNYWSHTSTHLMRFLWRRQGIIFLFFRFSGQLSDNVPFAHVTVFLCFEMTFTITVTGPCVGPSEPQILFVIFHATPKLHANAQRFNLLSCLPHFFIMVQRFFAIS